MPRTAIIIPVLLALTLGWVYYDLKKASPRYAAWMSISCSRLQKI